MFILVSGLCLVFVVVLDSGAQSAICLQNRIPVYAAFKTGELCFLSSASPMFLSVDGVRDSVRVGVGALFSYCCALSYIIYICVA